MTFTVENFESFLLILVRITAFIYAMPFFSLKDVPQKVKVGFSLFFAVILFQTVPSEIQYDGVIGYAAMVISEMLVGLIIGFFTNVSYYILSFAGQVMDMEIGFSMVNEFDPVSNIQTTITSNYYSYLMFQSFLIVAQAAVLLGYLITGTITPHVAGLTLWVLPCILLPSLLGARLYSRISAEAFRRVVLGLLFLSGAALLAQSVPLLAHR